MRQLTATHVRTPAPLPSVMAPLHADPGTRGVISHGQEHIGHPSSHRNADMPQNFCTWHGLHKGHPLWLCTAHPAFSSVQSLSHVQLFATPWTAARQASLSITNSRSLLKLMSIESVMPSNHLFFCHPLPLLPSIFPSIRVFSNELAIRIMGSKRVRHN